MPGMYFIPEKQRGAGDRAKSLGKAMGRHRDPERDRLREGKRPRRKEAEKVRARRPGYITFAGMPQ